MNGYAAGGELHHAVLWVGERWKVACFCEMSRWCLNVTLPKSFGFKKLCLGFKKTWFDFKKTGLGFKKMRAEEQLVRKERLILSFISIVIEF